MWRQKQTLEFCCQKSKNAWDSPKLEGAREDPPLGALERAWPYQHLGFRLLVSTIVRMHFALFSCPVWVLCCDSSRKQTQTPSLPPSSTSLPRSKGSSGPVGFISNSILNPFSSLHGLSGYWNLVSHSIPMGFFWKSIFRSKAETVKAESAPQAWAGTMCCLTDSCRRTEVDWVELRPLSSWLPDCRINNFLHTKRVMNYQRCSWSKCSSLGKSFKMRGKKLESQSPHWDPFPETLNFTKSSSTKFLRVNRLLDDQIKLI